jgi:hypothetical protein
MIVLGLAMLAVSVIGTVSAASNNLHQAPKLPSPGTVSIRLGSGSYAVYENVEDAAFPLDPASVSIIGPNGMVPATASRSTFSALGSPLAQTVYSSAIGFTVPSPGTYRVSVRASEVSLVIGKSPASVFHEVLGWIACGVVGVLLMVAGGVLAIVRRSRNPQLSFSR